ncbi:MAG: tripartite tricarboxylate transporter TctB family protein [Rhodobacteraceae bacterium]|nr:tripartite tricarboxylate transporter TctB family protein [Paracoccaceae bacterium]
MKSAVEPRPLRSAAASRALRSAVTARRFSARCAPDTRFRIDDLMAFRRGRGDLVFSAVAFLAALGFLAAFWTQTGWEGRKLPDDMGQYLLRQLGVIEGEGRLTRLGRILKQSWVAPMACLAILVPAAALNLRASLRVHLWRRRFRQPTGLRHELSVWLRALEFVGWFGVYTLAVPVLGYLVSTLLLGTLLPWRMGYRSWRWFGICLATSLCIVVVFRTALQIKTPINIWLYGLLPPRAEGFMQTWF